MGPEETGADEIVMMLSRLLSGFACRFGGLPEDMRTERPGHGRRSWTGWPRACSPTTSSGPRRSTAKSRRTRSRRPRLRKLGELRRRSDGVGGRAVHVAQIMGWTECLRLSVVADTVDVRAQGQTGAGQLPRRCRGRLEHRPRRLRVATGRGRRGSHRLRPRGEEAATSERPYSRQEDSPDAPTLTATGVTDPPVRHRCRPASLGHAAAIQARAAGAQRTASTRLPLSGQLRSRARLRRTADIVFTRRRIAVLIDGCFWHRARCTTSSPRRAPSSGRPRSPATWPRDAETNSTSSRPQGGPFCASGSTRTRRRSFRDLVEAAGFVQIQPPRDVLAVIE